jgi:Fic family protein
MVSIKIKRRGNKAYLYAEHSFRLPNSKVIKLSKLIKSREESKSQAVNQYFIEKEALSYAAFALQNYKTGSVLTKEKIQKLEMMRVEYKNILRKLSKSQMKDVLDRFTVNFTYESNAIEGNSLTLKDVTLLLHENILPKGKDLREVYETRNTRLVNGLLFKNKIKITIKGILELHALLVKDTGVREGFKQLPNYLLMRNVKTTLPESVEKEMNLLVKWYHQVKDKEHPLKVASQFHGKFEKIHPFEDGNGRVGRILINAMLLEQGYPPIIIRKSMRASYFSALEASDNNYPHKLERFLLEKMENTFKNFFGVYVRYL